MCIPTSSYFCFVFNFFFEDKRMKNETSSEEWDFQCEHLGNSFENNFGFGRLPLRRLGCGWLPRSSPNSEGFSNLGNNINIYQSCLDFAINFGSRRFWI